MIAYYEPDIVTAQDYFPFGMLSREALPNSGVPYKFGFNGKMNDNEVKGLGLQQDYGMRIYDNRIGRFLSTDPLSAKFPYYSPYQFSGNNPIRYIDLDGAEQFDPQSVPTGITHISSATAPGVVQQTRSVWIGNYELRGLVGVNGESYWIARYHYKEGRFKGMYNDEWVVGPDGVKDLAKNSEGLHNRSEWISELGGTTGPFRVRSITDGYKKSWNAQNVMAGIMIGIGAYLSMTPELKVGTKVSPQKQARHLPDNAKGNMNVMQSVEAAQKVVDALHSGEAQIVDFKDFGKKGGGVTQVDVEYKGVTGTFYTRNQATGEMVSTPTNRFRVEGTGNKVKVFPINPAR